MATKRSVQSSPTSSQSSSSHAAKRPKASEEENADESFGMTFEDQLALMNVLAEEGLAEEMDAGPSSSQKLPWERPSVKIIQEEKDAIVFQQIDLDHYLGQPLQGMPGAQEGTVPIVRMYGVTDEGHSVLAHVHGFLPHFYVPAPSDTFSDEDCATFHSALDSAVRSDARGGQGLVKAVLAVEMEQKSSMYNFHFNRKHPFLKVTMATPKLLAPAKRLLEQGITVSPYGLRGYTVYETNVEFEVRFMVDTGVVGCNWIECPPGKYRLRRPAPSPASTTALSPLSRCQIELDISWEDFISHAPEKEWQRIAPVRILSFDIECAGRKGVFPEADQDPVIQIANMVICQGDKDPFVRNIFTLHSCAPIVGSHVMPYDREDEMLSVSSTVSPVSLLLLLLRKTGEHVLCSLTAVDPSMQTCFVQVFCSWHSSLCCMYCSLALIGILFVMMDYSSALCASTLGQLYRMHLHYNLYVVLRICESSGSDMECLTHPLNSLSSRSTGLVSLCPGSGSRHCHRLQHPEL